MSPADYKLCSYITHRVDEWRREHGKTIEEFAEASGMSGSALSTYRHHQRAPRDASIQMFASFFDVSPEKVRENAELWWETDGKNQHKGVVFEEEQDARALAAYFIHRVDAWILEKGRRTQHEFADAARIPSSTISRMRKLDRGIQGRTLKKAAIFFGETPAQFTAKARAWFLENMARRNEAMPVKRDRPKPILGGIGDDLWSTMHPKVVPLVADIPPHICEELLERARSARILLPAGSEPSEHDVAKIAHALYDIYLRGIATKNQR